jgi:hypothetical protein
MSTWTVRVSIRLEPDPNDGERNFGSIFISGDIAVPAGSLREAQDVIDKVVELAESVRQ